MPVHHASAVQISLPTGWFINRARTLSTMAVTGWFWAKARTGAGMVSVDKKAELINGRKTRGYANAPAPSAVLALRPAKAAIQVSANVKNVRMPVAPRQFKMPAGERKPMRNATTRMMASDRALDIRDVRTCAHNAEDAEIGIEFRRSKKPLLISSNIRIAV